MNREEYLEHELELSVMQCNSLRNISEKYRQELEQLRDFSDVERVETLGVTLYIMYSPTKWVEKSSILPRKIQSA